jgi:glucose-6-phosphate isomerase
MMEADVLTRWPALGAAEKRTRLDATLHVAPGPLTTQVAGELRIAELAAQALFRREPAAWSADPDVQRRISARLGWLDAPLVMADRLDRLASCAGAVRRDGFDHILLLGMGGSSLAPEVLHAVLAPAADHPRFRMLDSTDPAAVRAAATPPERTLYLLASKSGSTIEPNALAAHFRSRLEAAGIRNWGAHFIAITDPETSLEELARAERFRDVFLNPADIGGRYSALSFFGLVPAALMGVDVATLLGWGIAMLDAAENQQIDALSNPAVGLGLVMATAARAGRDKLTLQLPDSLEAFGLWIEQLVAESTGKVGTGIVPIAGEPEGPADAYGADRFFVRVSVGDHDSRRAAETAAGPSVALALPEPAALGAEFVRWEIATAIAGALLHVNPFDEPNVQQAKDATTSLLDRFRAHGVLPVPPPDRTESGVAMTLTAAARQRLGGQRPESLLTLVQPGDYVVLLTYLPPGGDLEHEATAFRRAVRDRTGAATMFGYGPRYLHSTGQLHKGGPPSGVFVLVSATPTDDLPVPGQPFSFGTLELAQALGDFTSLGAAGRRALHLHLPAPDAALLGRTLAALVERLPRGV